MSRPPNLKEGDMQCFPRVSGDEPREQGTGNRGFPRVSGDEP